MIKYSIKSKNGITLIALVITIIVLLILAGVSISMLMGENGLLTKAADSKEETRGAAVKEAVDLWKTNKKLDRYTSDNTAGSIEDLIESLGPSGQNLLTADEIDEIEDEGQITIGSRTIVFEEDKDDIDILRDYFVGKECIWNLSGGMTYLPTFDISGVRGVDKYYDNENDYIYIEYKNNLYKLTVTYNYDEDRFRFVGVDNETKSNNVGIIDNKLVTISGQEYENYEVVEGEDYAYIGRRNYSGSAINFFYDSYGILLYYSYSLT